MPKPTTKRRKSTKPTVKPTSNNYVDPIVGYTDRNFALRMPTNAPEGKPILSPADYAQAVKPRANFQVVQINQDRALAALYGGEALYQFIKPYSRLEESEKLGWRRERTVDHWEGYPEEIAAQYVEGVYKSNEVTRETGNKDLDEYFSSEYDQWFQGEAAPMILMMPEVFFFINPPDTKGVPLQSMADQQELKAWSRPEIVLPSMVTNFALNPDGTLLWVSRQFTRPDGKTTYYEVLDALNRTETDAKGNVLTIQKHGFTEIPVVRRVWRTNKMFLGNLGVAYLALVVAKSIADLQVVSMLVESGYFHLNLQLVMDEQTFEKTMETGTGASRPIVFAGDKDKNIPPYYIQKPEMELQVLHRWHFEDFPRSIYRSARLRDRFTEKAVTSSGASKLQDTVPEIRALATVANLFQSIDEDIVRKVATQFTGGRKATVRYPARFDIRNASDLLDEVGKLASIKTNGVDMISPTALGELMKSLFLSMLPDLDPKTQETIKEEIDELVQDMIEADDGDGTDESQSVDGMMAAIEASLRATLGSTGIDEAQLTALLAKVRAQMMGKMGKPPATPATPDAKPDGTPAKGKGKTDPGPNSKTVMAIGE